MQFVCGQAGPIATSEDSTYGRWIGGSMTTLLTRVHQAARHAFLSDVLPEKMRFKWL